MPKSPAEIFLPEALLYAPSEVLQPVLMPLFEGMTKGLPQPRVRPGWLCPKLSRRLKNTVSDAGSRSFRQSGFFEIVF